MERENNNSRLFSKMNAQRPNSWFPWQLSEILSEECVDNGIVSSNGSTQLPINFSSSEEYFSVFPPFVLDEIRCSLRHGFDSIYDRPGECNIPIDEISPDGPRHLVVTIQCCNEPSHRHFRPLDVLLLTTCSDASLAEMHPHFIGLIRQIYRSPQQPDFATLRMECEYAAVVENDFKGAVIWRLSLLSSVATGVRILNAMHLKERPKFMDCILRPRLCLPSPSYLTKAGNNSFGNLNASQEKAVLTALSPNLPIVLIQGPPGTGKTKTLVAYLTQRLSCEDDVVTVVTASTNAAISEIAERLVRFQQKERNQPLRNLVLVGTEDRLQLDYLENIYLDSRRERLLAAFAGLLPLIWATKKLFIRSSASATERGEMSVVTNEKFSEAPGIEMVGQLLQVKIPQLIKYSDVVIDEIPNSIKDSKRTVTYLKKLSIILHQLSPHLHDIADEFHRIKEMSASDNYEATQSWETFLHHANIRPSFLGTDNYNLIRQLRSALNESNSIRFVLLMKMDAASLEKCILQSAKMTFSTVSGAGKKVMQAVFKAKCIVVIDEAAQVVEAESILTLRRNTTKLILAGDPKQLPATVFSSLCLENCYGRSLFERLQLSEWPVCFLSQQYRMHPSISQWPSLEFYGGTLQDAECVLQGDYNAIWHHDNTKAFGPFGFFDVPHGKEKIDKRTMSKFNVVEAESLLALLNQFAERFASSIEKRLSIGIISPYRAQVAIIRDLLSKKAQKLPEDNNQFVMLGKLHIDVRSVDSFQGQERDIIMFSAVRSGASIGFLKDERRLNVAITRARLSLWIFGHAQCLRTAERVWASLINFCQQQKGWKDTTRMPFILPVDKVQTQMIEAKLSDDSLNLGQNQRLFIEALRELSIEKRTESKKKSKRR